MKIYKQIAQNHSFESEMAMAGIIVMMRVGWHEHGIKQTSSFDLPKIDVTLQSNGEQITIVPKKNMQKMSDVTMFTHDSSFLIRKENGEIWRMCALTWNGVDDSAITMLMNSRYSINISGCDKPTLIEVNAIKDESRGRSIRTNSIFNVESSQEKEQLMQVDKGLIVGITVPISFEPDNMDYKIIISHENGEDIEYGENDLLYLSLANDSSKSVALDEDMTMIDTYGNNSLTIPLINSSSAVRKVRVVNNTANRLEFVLTTLRNV